MPKVIANRGGSNDRSGREVPSLTPQRVPTPVNALTKNQVLGNIANEIDPFQYAVYGEDNSNSEVNISFHIETPLNVFWSTQIHVFRGFLSLQKMKFMLFEVFKACKN